MWGAGTALGELPPYFMAKAARISGEEPDDEEYRYIFYWLERFFVGRRLKFQYISLLFFREFLAHINRNGPKAPTFAEKCKEVLEKAVTRLGFFGILSFASVGISWISQILSSH